MTQNRLKYLTAAIALLLTACSSSQQRDLPPEQVKAERQVQQELALGHAFNRYARVQDIAFPLLTLATERCGRRNRDVLGIALHTADDYPKAQQDASQALFGPLDGVHIKHRFAGSHAATVLKDGDKLLSINNTPVPDSSSLTSKRLSNLLEHAPSEPISLNINRKGEPLTVEVKPTRICNYPVLISGQDAVNAYADGSSITLNAGLIRFASKDEELALIIAHELAHNIDDHGIDKLKGGIAGALVDVTISAATGGISPGFAAVIGANIFSQQYEVEADQLAIQLLHQRGYKIDNLPEFWRRMATIHPSSITHDDHASHPTTVERYLIMRAEVDRLLKTNSTGD